MAVALVQQQVAAAKTVASITTTFATAPATDSVIVMRVSVQDYTKTGTASGLGATWTLLDRSTHTSADALANETWIGVNPNGTSTTATWTFNSGATDTVGMNVSEWSGAKTTIAAPSKSSGFITTHAHTPSASPGVIIWSVAGANNGEASFNNPSTIVPMTVAAASGGSASTQIRMSGAYLPISNNNVVTATWTMTATAPVAVQAFVLEEIPEIVSPDAPTNLTATSNVASIDLSWTAPTTGITPTSYNVYRRERGPEILSGDNATFTNSTGEWVAGSGASLFHDPAQGRMTLEAEVSGATDVRAPSITIDGGSAFPSGTTVTFSIDIINTTRQASLRIDFYDLDGFIVPSGQFTDTYSLNSGRRSFSATVPSTTVFSAFARVAMAPGGLIDDALTVDNASISLSSGGATLIQQDVLTTTHSDATAAAETTYDYYVKSVAGGVESVASNIATGSLATIVVPSMIEMVGIPI